MRTTARLDDDERVGNGTKAFITNAETAITSFVTVLALTDGNEVNKREHSTIIIPNGTVGFRSGPAYSRVGWCASDTRELSFADCRLPAANLLGHAARLAWYDTAARLVAQVPFVEAAMAKLLASNAARDNASGANQIVDGAGFMNESLVGRFYRDAKILEIGEGTADAHRPSSWRCRVRRVPSVSTPFLSHPALSRGSLRSASQAITA